MTQTLKDLKSGRLIGTKTLKLAEGLKEFPEEILSLADTLEVLDLSDNLLTKLPDSIAQLKRLKILFIARNSFRKFPSILAKLPILNMIGFKSNQIKTIPENAFPPKLNWLILTDNKIEQLPKSIGNCHLLQKCMLAGNLIEKLPIEMANCVNLELLRISANKLTSIPKWLFELPKLSWVAFSGNPASNRPPSTSDLASFNWNNFTIKERLGEGASGLISKANWHSKKEAVAIKIFKGAVTSDGFPADEMNVSIAVGAHKNLIPILGEIKDHPENKSGLIMKLISSTFINLGNPPNFETCTRDVFDNQISFNKNELLKIAKSMASVCAHLHKKGINHGDFYAHNILFNENADSLLGDFGAASFYDVNSDVAHYIERIEVRAFGCLLEDVLGLVRENEMDQESLEKWQQLILNSSLSNVKLRMGFSEILEVLDRL